MSIKVTIEKDYELGYTNDRLCTFPRMFELGIYMNGHSYMLQVILYMSTKTWTVAIVEGCMCEPKFVPTCQPNHKNG